MTCDANPQRLVNAAVGVGKLDVEYVDGVAECHNLFAAPTCSTWAPSATGRESTHCTTSLPSHATRFSASRRRLGNLPDRNSQERGEPVQEAAHSRAN